MPNFAAIGGIIAKIFFIFQDGGRRHLGFLKFEIFNGLTSQEGQTVSSCQISRQSVRLLLRCGDFLIFNIVGRPPSWICNADVWTTHKGHMLVFITVQNFVGIDAVVSIICMFL